LKNEYPDFGASYPVVHYTQYLLELHQQGRLKPNNSNMGALAYHDSCYLGRWNGIYQAPRDLLRTMNASGSLIELQRTRDKGFCCGAGGGRMFMEETLGKRINIDRAEEVMQSCATTLAAACPFCATMLQDGLMDKESDIVVKDIAEIVDEATA
jgi:Fe-S oxidoreductase